MSTPTSKSTELYTFQGKIITRTLRALLIATHPDKTLDAVALNNLIESKDKDINSMWIPFSQVKQLKETFSVISGELDTITITNWMAKQKGMV